MNSPESVLGKKSCPRNGNNRNPQRQTPRNAGTKSLRAKTSRVSSDLIRTAHALETSFEATLENYQRIAGCAVFLGPKQVHGEGGHQRAGKNIGSDHGEHDRLGQGREQITRNALQKEHGQEDDADAKRRNQGGHGNLRGAIEDRLAQLVSVFEKALDVFDGHGGIVHQDADGQGEAAQGHGVDRLVQSGSGR